MPSPVGIFTDFHTHLLPDLDCSGHPDRAAALIANIRAAGVENVVLTPHLYPQLNASVDAFLRARDRKIQALMTALDEQGQPKLRFFAGAEVLLCAGLEHMEGLDGLCVGNTRTLLVEMPDVAWNDSLLASLTALRDERQLDVLIAHAERYGKERAERLIRRGFKVQINAESFGGFGQKRMLLDWAKSGYVYALGSDKHVHSDKNTPVYKAFVKAAGCLGPYAALLNERMQAMLGL